MAEIPIPTEALLRDPVAAKAFLSNLRLNQGRIDDDLTLYAPKVELLAGLVNTRGERVGSTILYSLLENPEIDGVVIAGQPSAGKSTLLGQLGHSLQESAQIRDISLTTATVHYDDFLKEASKRKPPDPDTLAFNQRLVLEIQHPRSERWKVAHIAEELAPRHIVLSEVPAVGYGARADKPDQKDRGVSAFEELAKEDKRKLFVYVVAHPLNQKDGVFVRFIVSIFPAKEVVGMLKKHNVVVDAPGVDDDEVLGRRIKDTFRWSAKARHIAAILEEMGRQFHSWYRFDRESIDKIAEKVLLPPSYDPTKVHKALLDGIGLMDSRSQLLKEFDLPFASYELADTLDRLVKMHPNRRAYMPKVEATFAEDRFRKLGVPPDRGIVAFSPPVEGPIHLYITA